MTDVIHEVILDLSACGIVVCFMIVEIIAFDWIGAKWRMR